MKVLNAFVCILCLQQANSNDTILIREKLEMQAVAWNSGDLNGFMDVYERSDSLVFVGKSGVTYGWDNVLRQYKKRYPTQKEMGSLHFDVLELRLIGKHHYLMIGRWSLKREVGDIEGYFSLVWQMIDGDWFIVYDHSS
jgi:ketosteroid isomerase-like protein